MTGSTGALPRPFNAPLSLISHRLDDLERRHDDAPSRGVLRTALLDGSDRHAALARAAVLRLHDRLAAEARQGAARRRRALPADRTAGDAWLSRLTTALAHHRNAASLLFLAEA
ncbi:hypothetical protein FBZ84_111213 [Azospirillum baldaniorum]|uniref:hypothetical protein n=1 Tax=Azospirillum baldaniorum TaxID=1064539 RepID=UPI0011A6EDBB|nr:hypothetical protein [Azospirillum baldaniorum]TWA62435.1 hypothetical protein FBZ84_111213 [Azospirillum baldaniorum]